MMRHLKHIPGLGDISDFSSMKIAVVLSASFTGIQAIIQSYVFDHMQWVSIICIALLMDTLSGVLKSWKLCQFSSYAFGAIFIKAVIYGMFVFLLGGMGSMESEILKAFSALGYSTILFRETLSFIENCEVLRPGTFPSVLVKRLSQFDEDGKFKEDGQS